MITGLVLFAYVATHLINHALGLISLPAMGIGRSWFLALWRQPVGTMALYGSLTVHFALGLWALYARRGWRMPVSEAAQILLDRKSAVEGKRVALGGRRIIQKKK